jgi:hypothetical protein
MKKKCVAIECILLALMAFDLRCSLGPESRLNRAVDRYLERKPDALQSLEKEFLDSIAIEKIRGRELQSTGSILYRLDRNDADIIYPQKRNLSMDDGEGVSIVDLSADYIVLSDGLRFSVFDVSGSHRNDEIVGDNKNRVKALLLTGDDIIYYKNFNLYRYSIINKSSEMLLKEPFPPPYEKYYSVRLRAKDTMLHVLAGSAGTYYYSIVNYETQSVVLKNLVMSSSKLYAGATDIRYIAGNSGSWEMIQYTVPTKKKKTIAKLNDIMDIELAVGGFLWENQSGLWAAEYGKDRVRVPFSYQLAGTYKGRVLLAYKNYCHIIDMKKLFMHLDLLKIKAPDLFNTEKPPDTPQKNK